MRALPALLCGAVVLGSLGCQSLPMAVRVLPPDDPSVARALEELRRLDQDRRSLRASARVTLRGATGAGFARHLLLVERPARLRLEVLGLVGQRVAVLASDGDTYDLYRAETGRVERGPVTPELLGEVVGVPLAGPVLVALLLGVPPHPMSAPQETTVGADGRLALRQRLPSGGEQQAVLDGGGRLVALRLLDPAGRERVAVGYDDHSEAEGFARELRFQFGDMGLEAAVSFRQWELDPELAAGLFRLQPVSSSGG